VITLKLRKTEYDKFVAAFSKRYKGMIKTDRKPTEAEMLKLFSEFKSSILGSPPNQGCAKVDEWFHSQEIR
jgi:hypothetical protein